MTPQKFYIHLCGDFPFNLTNNQAIFYQKMIEYLFKDDKNELFVLKGYAGTGKTTAIATLVKNLFLINKKYVLLAPTGRAAKVIGNYANKQAFTIHKRIYFPKSVNGGVQFTMQQNKHKNTLFVVDESSMISDSFADSKYFVNGSLLHDLMAYVEEGTNCKLLFIGDTAQLPPVKSELSPALDIDQLRFEFNKEVIHIEFDEVMRQAEDSGILYNATLLREEINGKMEGHFKFNLKTFADIVHLVDGYDVQNAIFESYDTNGTEETAFIVRSNKRANQYNQQIRTQILGNESDISPGDLLMVVKNNYFWLKESSDAGFIANGDTIEILEIYKRQELYGFQFATVKVRMIDYPNQPAFETVLLLDTLTSESPSLTYEQSNSLYQEVNKDYENERQAYKKLLKVKQNPYFNALQVKFAYAFTCHKSQGGQWNTVFVEQPYLPDGVSIAYYRWLYTAMTRAKNKLYLLGFKDDFFTHE